MNCQKMDSIESLKAIIQGPKRSNLTVLLLFANFLKSGLITVLHCLYAACWG